MSKTNTDIKSPQEKVLSRITTLSLGSKHKLFAIWLSKKRLKESKTLDVMLNLDNIYLEKYNENRINYDSTASKLLAHEYMLSLIYGY